MQLPDFEPSVNSDTAFYWEGTRESKLLLQKCLRCAQIRHPPSPVCAVCGSLEWEPWQATGSGTLYCVAKSHSPTFFQESGYLICLVDLAEGVRIATNLRGCELADATPGMPVELFFEPLAAGFQLPQFRPSSH
jgi:hypothetical protein